METAKTSTTDHCQSEALRRMRCACGVVVAAAIVAVAVVAAEIAAAVDGEGKHGAIDLAWMTPQYATGHAADDVASARTEES